VLNSTDSKRLVQQQACLNGHVPGLAKPPCLQEAEESLRQELHRRTSTILGLQAKLDGQDAALAAAEQQQAALQGQLQVGHSGTLTC
jgi:hypothetical protein